MSEEHWAEEEIGNLRAQKSRLEEREAAAADQEARENIWKQAFSNPAEKWRLPARFEEEFRKHGFPASDSSTLITADTMSPSDVFLRLKRNLLRGACDYLMMHPPADNRITTRDIYEVLHSSREFGRFIAHNTIYWWISGRTGGFDDIVEEYAIDRNSLQTIDERYARAIRTWWRDHPGEVKPTFSDIARSLKIDNSWVNKKIRATPALLQLMTTRPSENSNTSADE
ncbi:hypothetical protein HY417_02740 [Candidatus Kaiserbacteria bacterium]|nr:hypothetical protein [Candidatus Kaiserbacteria bacterium]